MRVSLLSYCTADNAGGKRKRPAEQEVSLQRSDPQLCGRRCQRRHRVRDVKHDRLLSVNGIFSVNEFDCHLLFHLQLLLFPPISRSVATHLLDQGTLAISQPGLAPRVVGSPAAASSVEGGVYVALLRTFSVATPGVPCADLRARCCAEPVGERLRGEHSDVHISERFRSGKRFLGRRCFLVQRLRTESHFKRAASPRDSRHGKRLLAAAAAVDIL